MSKGTFFGLLIELKMAVHLSFGGGWRNFQLLTIVDYMSVLNI